MIGVLLQHRLINRNRLRLRMRVFLEGDSAGKKLRYIFGLSGRLNHRNRIASDQIIARSKIKHELTRDRFKHLALMTERNPASGIERSRLEQRILHPRRLLLHGRQRFPDHRRAHLARAQVAHFLDLQEVEKGIDFRGGDQSSFFPSANCRAVSRKIRSKSARLYLTM